MATMTFQINDASTGSTNPAVWVTITENPDGTLTFTVTQEGGIIGDLRGLFFDMADESILKSLVITADSTDIRIGDDSIKDLGDGSNMNGLLGEDKGYDVGIEIGTAGIGSNDIQSYSFTLDSTLRDLSLADLSSVDFAARLTSVGVIGGTRADSSKILEMTSQAIAAGNDVVMVDENNAASGNVLANDATGGGTNTVTGWSGGTLGSTVTLASGTDQIGTLQFNADGSYVVDASAADELSAGESIVYNFTYDVQNQTEATSWSTDTANLMVVINGTNDGPVANDDDAGTVAENETLSGSVTANDSDVDRRDTHTWALVDGSFDGQGSLTMNADGTWSYDAQGAYDSLNDGESVNLSFQYQMTDNHGASDTAVVTFAVTGVGSVEPPPSDDSYPTFQKDISHAVLVFDTTNGDRNGDGYYTVKIDEWAGDTDLEQTDLDASIDDILSWLVANDANIDADTVFLGAQIKGGNVGTASDSYDDYWANDGDNSYTIATISGSGTITEWVSGDEAPVDMSQDFQKEVDTTYEYNFVV